jgi:hypothetical protein
MRDSRPGPYATRSQRSLPTRWFAPTPKQWRSSQGHLRDLDCALPITASQPQSSDPNQVAVGARDCNVFKLLTADAPPVTVVQDSDERVALFLREDTELRWTTDLKALTCPTTAPGTRRWKSTRERGVGSTPKPWSATRPLEALVIGGYLRGLSDRDNESLAEEAELGHVSKITVSRICRELLDRYTAFCNKSLADVDATALFMDATYLPTRPSGQKEGVLVV